MEPRKTTESDPRMESQKAELRAILEKAVNGCVDLIKGPDKTEKDADLIGPVINALRNIQEGIK